MEPGDKLVGRDRHHREAVLLPKSGEEEHGPLAHREENLTLRVDGIPALRCYLADRQVLARTVAGDRVDHIRIQREG